MKKIKTFSYVALALLLVMVSVIACQPAAEKPNNENNGYDMNDNNYDMNNNNRYNDNLDYKNIEEDDGVIDDNDIGNDMYNINDNDIGKRGDRISGTLSQMNGIRGTAVVISDNTAIVGVDTGVNNRNGITEDMRRKIESAVKRADNRIDEVRITNDNDMYDRINNMVLAMRRGRPATDFNDEMRDIMDRITTNLY